MMKTVVLSAVASAVLLAVPALAQPAQLQLRAGETRSFSVEGLQKLAVGDPEVADVHVEGKSLLEVTARRPGTTTLITWSGKGVRTETTVHVRAATPDEKLVLGEGEAKVLRLGEVSRVVVGDPEIADIKVDAAGAITVKGQTAGATTLLVWRKDRPVHTVEVVVR